jgi:hypothetical protein
VKVVFDLIENNDEFSEVSSLLGFYRLSMLTCSGATRDHGIAQR